MESPVINFVNQLSQVIWTTFRTANILTLNSPFTKVNSRATCVPRPGQIPQIPKSTATASH